MSAISPTTHEPAVVFDGVTARVRTMSAYTLTEAGALAARCAP